MPLCGETATSEEAKSKIAKADIIYVGGGNTEHMMTVWRECRVDQYHLEAYQDNKILAGLSAGSICWFIAGVENPKHKWVKGLGIIPYLHCPHFDEESRRGFDDFYIGQITDAIAIDNQAAIVWENGNMRVIKSNPGRTHTAFPRVRTDWSRKGFHRIEPRTKAKGVISKPLIKSENKITFRLRDAIYPNTRDLCAIFQVKLIF